MECILCNEQYVGKAETSFNIRLSNHRKDVKKVNAIMACIINRKATISTNMQNLPLSKKKEKNLRLIEREDFWILKLDTLYPEGFNMGLSK